MVDPTKRYIELTDAAQKDVERLGEAAEREMPQYSRSAKELTPEEQHRDYVTTMNNPDGPKVVLREWKEKYGLVRAVNMLLDWSKENEGRV